MAHVRVLIVGAGFAGVGMAIRLKQAGIADFAVMDALDGPGGTWRANVYPGCACDVESHLYSLSFAPNPHWTRKFSPQPEILAYIERTVRDFGLEPHMRYGVEARTCRFDEADNVWHVETSAGDSYTADVLISATGGLSRPAYPAIAGLDTFAGRTMHSARWNRDFDATGLRVGVVGTGASAVQIVPALAPKAKHLTVFQRTPGWVIPRFDRPHFAWERALYAAFPPARLALRGFQYVTKEIHAVGMVYATWLLHVIAFFVRFHLRSQIPDPVLREKLTPRYTIACKRILLSDDYYPTFLRPNVTLETSGIERVEPDGVRLTDGRLVELDALVLATGFQAAEFRLPYPIVGRGGIDLNDAWADGPEAYLGTTVAGFPNMFVLIGPNTGLGHNSMIYMMESQFEYVLDALNTLFGGRSRRLEVRREAQAAYNAEIQRRLATTVWNTGGCTAWYRTKSGKNTTIWPGFTFLYRLRTRRFDADAYEFGG